MPLVSREWFKSTLTIYWFLSVFEILYMENVIIVDQSTVKDNTKYQGKKLDLTYKHVNYILYVSVYVLKFNFNA
jgi:hypothetical protein